MARERSGFQAPRTRWIDARRGLGLRRRSVAARAFGRRAERPLRRSNGATTVLAIFGLVSALSLACDAPVGEGPDAPSRARDTLNLIDAPGAGAVAGVSPAEPAPEGPDSPPRAAPTMAPTVAGLPTAEAPLPASAVRRWLTLEARRAPACPGGACATPAPPSDPTPTAGDVEPPTQCPELSGGACYTVGAAHTGCSNVCGVFSLACGGVGPMAAACAKHTSNPTCDNEAAVTWAEPIGMCLPLAPGDDVCNGSYPEQLCCRCEGTATCADVVASVAACGGGAACEDAALAQASPVGAAAYQGLLACVEPACGPAPTLACVWQWAETTCPGLHAQCFLGCEPLCDGAICGDDGCGGSCGDCDDGAACTADACVDGACAHVPLADGAPCDLGGCPGTCSGGECLPGPSGACGPADLYVAGGPGQTCTEACLTVGSGCAGPGSVGGQCEVHTDAVGCLAPEAWLYVAVLDACVEDLGGAPCTGPIPPDASPCCHCAGFAGPGACGAIVACMAACPDGSTGCGDACFEAGSDEARARYLDVALCLTLACGATDTACQQAALAGECAAPYAECLGAACVPDCAGKACGGDGCGGSCGSCADGNPCTADLCDGGACTHQALPVTCDDGNPCSTASTCQDGACVGTVWVSCAADGPCAAGGACDPATGACVDAPAPDGLPCDDGDPCTVGTTCQGGACAGGAPKACPAPGPCTPPGTCSATSGQCAYAPLADGAPCDDGDACTTGESCQGGVCTGGSAPACPPADGCHIGDACDPLTGACTTAPLPNGTPCDDGDPCTVSDVCVAGACHPGAPVQCPPADGCHVLGVCDPATGACTPQPAPSGVACSDGDACTQGDQCVGGACVPGAPVPCGAATACREAGTCDPALGCVSAPRPDGTPCDDGNPCTEGDACKGGACASGPVGPVCGVPVKDLGPLLGVLAFTEEQPDGRWRGWRVITEGCPAGAVCEVEALGLVDGTGEVTEVEVHVTANLGVLGLRVTTATWVEGGFCLSHEVVDDASLGLPLPAYTLVVCLDDAGLSSVTLEQGTLELADQFRSFTATLDLSPPWGLHIVVQGDVALSEQLVLREVTLDATTPEPGEPQLTVAADLDLGELDAPLAMRATGVWSVDGTFSLDLTQKPGTSWALPGADSLPVEPEVSGIWGTLSFGGPGLGWTVGVGLTVTAQIDAFGPMGQQLVATGTLVLDSGDRTIRGCIGAPGVSAGVIPGNASQVLAELCFGPDGLHVGLGIKDWYAFPGLGVPTALGRVEVVDGAWRFAIQLGDLAAKDDPLGDHVFVSLGPAGFVKVVGEVLVEDGALLKGSLALWASHLKLPGASATVGGELQVEPDGYRAVFHLGQWAPFPGLVVSEAYAALTVEGGAWSFSACLGNPETIDDPDAPHAVVDLGTLGTVDVYGCVDVLGSGTWLSGKLTVEGLTLELPWVAGTAKAQLVITKDGFSITLVFADWEPFPGLILPAAGGTIVRDEAADDWSYSLFIGDPTGDELAPTTIQAGPLGELLAMGDLPVGEDGNSPDGCVDVWTGGQAVPGVPGAAGLLTGQLCMDGSDVRITLDMTDWAPFSIPKGANPPTWGLYIPAARLVAERVDGAWQVDIEIGEQPDPPDPTTGAYVVLGPLGERRVAGVVHVVDGALEGELVSLHEPDASSCSKLPGSCTETSARLIFGGGWFRFEEEIADWDLLDANLVIYARLVATIGSTGWAMHAEVGSPEDPTAPDAQNVLVALGPLGTAQAWGTLDVSSAFGVEGHLTLAFDDLPLSGTVESSSFHLDVGSGGFMVRGELTGWRPEVGNAVWVGHASLELGLSDGAWSLRALFGPDESCAAGGGAWAVVDLGPPFGIVYVCGALDVLDNGAVLQGCLAAKGYGGQTPIAGEVGDLGLLLCFDADGWRVGASLEDWVPVPGFPFVLHDAVASYDTLGDAWSGTVTVGDPDDPGTGAVLGLGPLGSVAVSGVVSVGTDGSAPPAVSGCLSGSVEIAVLPPALTDNLELDNGDVVRVDVCFGPPEGFRVEVTLPQWRPLPFDPLLVVDDVVGRLEMIGGIWTVTFETELAGYCLPYPLDLLCPGDALAGVAHRLRARLTEGEGLVVEIFAKLRIALTDELEIVVDVAGQVKGKAELVLTGVYDKVVALLGELPGAELPSPVVDVVANFQQAVVELKLAGRIGLQALGQKLALDVTCDGALALGQVLWCQGSALRVDDAGSPVLDGAGDPAPFELLLDQLALAGDLCAALSTGDIPGKRLCQRPDGTGGFDATAGLFLYGLADLPRLWPDQEPAELLIRAETGDHLRLRAELDLAWEPITPAMDLPLVDRLLLQDLVFEAEVFGGKLGADTHMGFTGRGSFTPEGGTPIDATAALDFELPSTQASLTAWLHGRWLAPLGLEHVALESPGATFGLQLSGLSGVNIPTLVGVQGYAYLSQSGQWPAAKPPVPAGGPWEVCDDALAQDEDGDGLASCADPDCAAHLYCVAKKSKTKYTVGRLAVLYGLLPEETDLCPLGPGLACLRLPQVLVHLELGDVLSGGATVALDTMLDLMQALRTTTHTILSRAAQVASTLGEELGVDLPVDLAPPDYLLEELPRWCSEATCPAGTTSVYPFLGGTVSQQGITFSTHTAERWGTLYRAGMRLWFDATHGDDTVRFDGILDDRGLLLEGRARTSQDLFPTSAGVAKLAGDPLARSLRLPSANARLTAPSDARLELPRGTVEAWVRRTAWSTKDGVTAALLAQKIGAKAATQSIGTRISVGSPACVPQPAGGCVLMGRVFVRFGDGTKTHMATTDGVVPAGELVHLAVTWDHAEQDGADQTRVAVYVNGDPVPVQDAAIGADAVGPAPTTGVLVIGRGFAEVDDVRLWSVARTPGEVRAFSRFLPESYRDDPAQAGKNPLVLRYELDYDGDGLTAHNTRRWGSGAKLHGSLVDGAFTAPVDDDQDVWLRLNLRPDEPAEMGLWLRSGAVLQVPPLGTDIEAAAQVRVGGGTVSGSFEAAPATLLTIPGVGSVVLSGDGPDTHPEVLFDDGLYGSVDLGALSFQGSGRLRFVPASQALAPLLPGAAAAGAFSFQCPEGLDCPLAPAGYAMEASSDVALTIPFAPLDGLTLKGHGELFSGLDPDTGDPALSLVVQGSLGSGDGRLQVGAGTFTLTNRGIAWEGGFGPVTFEPLNFGQATAGFELDLVAGTLCISGSMDALNELVSCEVHACADLHGVTPEGLFTWALSAPLACGVGVDVCWHDAECAGGNVCLGALCVPPRVEWQHCSNDGTCKGDLRCSASGPLGICYDDWSKGAGEACLPGLTPPHCKSTLKCIGLPGLAGICLPPVTLHGKPCYVDEQCVDPDMVCRLSNEAPFIVAPNIVLGGTALGPGDGYCLFERRGQANREPCSLHDECASGLCKDGGLELIKGTIGQGMCWCTELGCQKQTAASYCGDDGQCHPKGHDGAPCCDAKECGAGSCGGAPLACPVGGQGACYTPGSRAVGQSCLANDHCASGLCNPLDGRCACKGAEDCPDGTFCNLAYPEKGPLGRYHSELHDFETCNPLFAWDCGGDQCGGLLPPKCWTYGARSIYQTCVTNDHCGTHSCVPHACNPNLTVCNPATIGSCFLTGDWEPCSSCGCALRCGGCDSWSDCPNHDTQFCGAHPFLGERICQGRKGEWSTCTPGVAHECHDGLVCKWYVAFSLCQKP